MLSNYLPILIYLAVATGVGVALLVIGALIGRYFTRYPDDVEKRSAYECGFEAFEDSRRRFDVRYYLVAILFIVFDLEIAFLFPWAVALDAIGSAGTRCRNGRGRSARRPCASSPPHSRRGRRSSATATPCVPS